MNPKFWLNKRVLVTGHTGFKGSWLSLWLHQLGAKVSGLALEPPTRPSLFEEAKVGSLLTQHTIGDIRDYSIVLSAIKEAQPDIVIHMAAQPLVRLSYVEPLNTYATNVMGTAHVLEACRQVGSIKAIVNVTTDKCYENRQWVWGYREDEPMGGHDPYSSSKGCAELVTSAYRRSFLAEGSCALASARAGNVIGGGDWATDRLIPDILRAIGQKQPVVIRNPHAIRPWQHVLEPLSGYLTLAECLYTDGQAYAEGFNFGPHDDDAKPVEWIVNQLVRLWGDGASWVLDQQPNPHEAAMLKLDISKAKQKLQWQPKWHLLESLERIVKWQKVYVGGGDVRSVCESQIHDYTELA